MDAFDFLVQMGLMGQPREICLFDYFWALRIMQTVLADIVASN